jgi:hypothetical protein
MSKKWTQINESMNASRSQDLSLESDMSELDASLAISEAISFAAEMKYRAKGLVQDICDFNTKAEEMEYTCQQYIEESFMVGGIIAAIIGLIILALKTVSSSMKAMGKGISTSIDKVLNTNKKLQDLDGKVNNALYIHTVGDDITVDLPNMTVLNWLLQSHQPWKYIYDRIYTHFFTVYCRDTVIYVFPWLVLLKL